MNETGFHRFQQGQSRYIHQTRPESKSVLSTINSQRDENGFTLVELLIVVTILPLIIGALSLGIISVFSLQSSVSNRVTDTADAQMVSADFSNDVQAAVYLTTDATSSPQCGAGTGIQLLAMESVLNQQTGNFQTVVSYVSVPVTSGATTTYSLKRLSCVNGSTTPSNVSTLAYDLPSSTFKLVTSNQVVQVVCETGAAASDCSNTTRQWTQNFVSAAEISTVTLNVTAPTTSYNYDLVASPAVSSSFNSGGSALPSAASCESTAASTGPYAGQLCFIDFSGLTQADLSIADDSNGSSTCYNMSVVVQGAYLMHFCLSYTSTNTTVGLVPSAIPSDTDAGLGNTVYPGIGGKPALYMSQIIGTTNFSLTLSKIYVVNASTGLKATGWGLVSADAETTNSGETLQWTSDIPLTVINDTEAGYSGLDGDACGLSGSGTATVTCTGVPTPSLPASPVFTGAAMVEATSTTSAPTTLTITTNNYEAFAFGMMLP
jgi:prepilin-type N-terminal cleavage/methylation domain-containing protein